MTDYLWRCNSTYDDAYSLQHCIEAGLRLISLMIACVMLQKVPQGSTRININGYKQPTFLAIHS